MKMSSWVKLRRVRFCPKGCGYVALAGTLMLAVVISCARTPEAEKGEMMPTPAGTYRFEGVPIPRSLAIEEEESFVYESEVIKTGILVYAGKARVGDLVRFFKENMGAHGWRLVSNFERNDALLSFSKPGWGCVIAIKPTAMQRAQVEVRVGPVESP
jgi:hypothetical protein